MRRGVVLLVFACVVLAAAVPVAHGGSVAGDGLAINGSIDGASPCYWWGMFDYHYDSTTFVAPATGAYSFTLPVAVGYMSLMAGSGFDPDQDFLLNPGYLASGGDVLAVSLQAGQTYTLVVDNNDGYGSRAACEAATATPSGAYSVRVSPGLHAAGCDQYLELDNAVVGTLVHSAPVYWRPGQSIDLTLEAGKSFWVLGMDSAQEHYQIYIQCQKVWIPADAIGPNYDDVWQGRPLPTTIIPTGGDADMGAGTAGAGARR